MVEHQDAIGLANGGEAVGNGKDGAILHQIVDGVLDLLLGDGVERGGGFVKDEDRRITQNGAGNGHALALSTAKDEALFADDAVVAFGVGHDKVVSIGELGGVLNLCLGGMGRAVGDVRSDGGVEEERLLGYRADDGAHIGNPIVANVVTINIHLAAADIVEAREEVGQGALAASG